MTTPPAELRVRPRGAWYLVVVVLWVASAVLIGTVVATFVRVVDDGVTPIQGSSITVPRSGLTLYSRTRPSTLDCVLHRPGGRPIEMDHLSYDINISTDSIRVHAVASTPSGLAAGSYIVSCPGASASQLYYGDRLPFGSILLRFAISGLLGLAGIVVLIVLLVVRHGSKSRIRTQRLLTSPGYGAGWPAGGYAQPPPYGLPSQPYVTPPPDGSSPPPPPYGTSPPPYDAGNPPR